AVSRLPVTTEDRTGYNRDSFRHWNAGLNPTDGCNTRAEVLISEAVTAPAVGARCALTGGSWWSYYDDQTVTSAGSLDIDHMVPLAEAWDSGASDWTPQRRESYANDQGQPSSLVAVTARSNRQKSDQDPAQWLPPAPDALCRYLSEWTATKLRWNLTADEAEQDRLFVL
ncbi:HNH endonuclease family protein, partial [Streptomyces amakusaensis]